MQGAHVRDSTFSLFASALIYKQNPLALLDPGGQRERSAVSVYRQHARELAEGFPEHVLPKNMHANGQSEPLASSGLFSWPKLKIHAMASLDREPSRDNSTGELEVRQAVFEADGREE